jgi:hypothetical protein
LLSLVVLGSSGPNPRFANGREGIDGVDGKPRLAGELRLPFGLGRRRFEHIRARRFIGRTESSVQRQGGDIDGTDPIERPEVPEISRYATVRPRRRLGRGERGQSGNDKFGRRRIAIAVLEGAALGGPQHSAPGREQLDPDHHAGGGSQYCRDGIRHTAEGRIQGEPAVRSGQRAWQRRVQIGRYGLAIVDGDEVDVLTEPAIREMCTRQAGAPDELDPGR